MIKLIKIFKIVKRKANMSNLKPRKNCCDQLSHFLQFAVRQLSFLGKATWVQHLVQPCTMNEPPYNTVSIPLCSQLPRKLRGQIFPRNVLTF